MADIWGESKGLSTLADAITAAFLALKDIRPDEKIVIANFVLMDMTVGGGWAWQLDVVSRRTIGNTKSAEAAPLDWRDHNTRELVVAATAAWSEKKD